MRIAEINDVASVASELTRGLQARGHEVTFIQPRLFGARLHWAIKGLVGPVRALEWLQLARRVRAGSYDMAHIHYAYMGIVGVLGRFPYILHCHGGDIRDPTLFTGWIKERALREAGHVFYATPDLGPAVLARRPDAEFLPNPVDTAVFAPLSPADSSAAVYIACALDDIKGAANILAACRSLASSRPDIRFTAIAGGPYSSRFAALPNVALVPHRPRAALPAQVSAHGIVVGQVFLGSAGMAELEAMSCGRPVIAFFRYGESYPEPPPFVQARTGAEIAREVVRLADDAALRREVGEQGRAWIECHHALGRISERVERVAAGVAGRRPSP